MHTYIHNNYMPRLSCSKFSNVLPVPNTYVCMLPCAQGGGGVKGFPIWVQAGGERASREKG